MGGNAEAEVVLYQPDSRLLATTLLSISAIFLTRVNWMKIQYVRNPYELPRWCSSKVASIGNGGRTRVQVTDPKEI